MQTFSHLSPKELTDNFFSRVDDGWMLVTAKNPETGKCNTMTASWGGTGILWNKPVAFVFLRPQRYTYEFAESAEEMTLSFFAGEQYRSALKLCGSVSGREHDKIAETGLTPVEDGGAVWFAEAELVLRCRKCYAEFLKEDAFLDRNALSMYAQKDFHKMYICEITDVLRKR